MTSGRRDLADAAVRGATETLREVGGFSSPVEFERWVTATATPDAQDLRREAEESARLAVYLASEDADFFVGQVVPFSGGWVTP